MHSSSVDAQVCKPPKFDFNEGDLFNPDGDSIEVAKKCWGWLLHPAFQDLSELGSILDKKGALALTRHSGYLDQQDHEDNLLSLSMFYQFVALNEKSDKPVMYSKDVQLY